MEKDKKDIFENSVFYSYLVKAKLRDALLYLKQYPEKMEEYQKYKAIFEREEYLKYEVDTFLNEILLIYQKYYRDVFYLEISDTVAEEIMRKRFISLFEIENNDMNFDEIEDTYIEKTFEEHGFGFLGDTTSGFYGPYIWKETEVREYKVELPDGIQEYQIKVLDGFISKSWLDYLSFGGVGTGGWVSGYDGLINCVKESYDFTSEKFLVSFLKHEAQHVMDKKKYPDMLSSEQLEYRAKLVEMIYSKERNLLKQFASEADTSNAKNGHAMAANRIVEGFKKIGKDVDTCSTEDIQTIARRLFIQSNEDVMQNQNTVR